MVYLPSVPVVAECGCMEFGLVATTVAPATVAPLGSLTVPTMKPVVDVCADPGKARPNSMDKQKQKITLRNTTLACISPPSKGRQPVQTQGLNNLVELSKPIVINHDLGSPVGLGINTLEIFLSSEYKIYLKFI